MIFEKCNLCRKKRQKYATMERYRFERLRLCSICSMTYKFRYPDAVIVKLTKHEQRTIFGNFVYAAGATNGFLIIVYLLAIIIASIL